MSARRRDVDPRLHARDDLRERHRRMVARDNALLSAASHLAIALADETGSPEVLNGFDGRRREHILEAEQADYYLTDREKQYLPVATEVVKDLYSALAASLGHVAAEPGKVRGLDG